MYGSRPTRPPSEAYQYNPQAVDDVDDHGPQDDNDSQQVHSPAASSIPRSNSGPTYNPLEARQDYAFDGPYIDQQPIQIHDGVHGTYGDGGGDPMEGGVDEDNDKLRKHPLLLAPGSNYKPTPLRWPFLTVLIALMVTAIALIVYANVAMPDSGSSATIRPGRRSVGQANAGGFTDMFGLKGKIIERQNLAPNDSIAESSILAPVSSLTSLVISTAPESTPTQPAVSTTSEERRPVDDSGLTTTSQGVASTPTSTTISTTPASTSTSSMTSTASTNTISSSATSTTSTTSNTSTTTSSTTSTGKTSTTSTTSTIATTGKISTSSATTTPTTINNKATPTNVRAPLNRPTTSATSATSTTSKSTTTTKATTGLKTTGLKGTGVIIITTSTPVATMTPTSTFIVTSTGFTQINSTMVITHSSSVLVTPTSVGGGGAATFTSVVVADTTQTVTFGTATVTGEPSGGFGVSGGNGGVVSTLYGTSESVGQITHTSTWVQVEPQTTGDGQPSYVATTSLETVTSAMSVPYTTTQTQTSTGHPYIVYGPVTITSSYTIAGGANDNNGGGGTTNGGGVAGNNNAPTHVVEAPVTNFITTVVGGKVDTIVQTVAPQTRVATVGGGLQTIVAGGVVETIVTRVGATPVTYVHGTPVTAFADGRGGSGVIVVVTPSPTVSTQTSLVTQPPDIDGNGNLRFNAVTVIDGQTVVNGETITVIDGATFIPQFSSVRGSAVTAVQVVDVTTAVIVTGADGLLTTQMQVVPTEVTSVATVGGTVMTVGMQAIDLQTVAQNIGQTVVTVDGTIKTFGLITVVTTGTGFQPITVTEVTRSNGTPVTTAIVTTPTVSDPITFTVAGGGVLSDYESYSVSMSGGSLVTIVRTRPPTTVVTSLSGHLTTFLSTPPPSTMLSTEASSTVVMSSVSTPEPASTSPNRNQPSNSPTVIVTTQVFHLQPAHYFVATFLPAFIAVLLSLPLRVIDLNAKMYLPFNALSGSSRHHNARGSESLTLDLSGILSSIGAPVAAAVNQGEPVPLLTTTLVALSSLLAPLATEALGLKLHGSCSVTNESGCAGALGVSPVPAYALVGLLALMVALLLALVVLLQRWRTGLRANPWNLAGIAALTACPTLLPTNARQRSRAVATEKSLRRTLKDKRLALGFYETAHGHEAFGIVPFHADDRHDDGNDSDDDSNDNLHYGGNNDDDVPSGQPFLALTVAYRAAFAIFLAALLVLVLVYHIVAAGAGGAAGTVDPTATRFGDWVATNSFGIRFAMAALGVTISFCWTTLFLSVAAVTPFQAMATPGRPQPPERSILLPLCPTNEFSGLWVALRLAFGGGRFKRQGAGSDNVPLRHAVYLGLVSLMTMASEFLPVLLANVPYNVTQTLEASVVCARLVAVVLVLMLLTLLASFVAVRWPALPADPRTLVGAMYYVVDSHVLPAALVDGVADTTGGACLALMDTTEKTARVQQLGRRYYYGDIVGRSGRRRLAVDADVTLVDPVVEGNNHLDVVGAPIGGPPPPITTTAYKGGAFYVYNHEARYQRQQQEEEPPFI